MVSMQSENIIICTFIWSVIPIPVSLIVDLWHKHYTQSILYFLSIIFIMLMGVFKVSWTLWTVFKRCICIPERTPKEYNAMNTRYDFNGAFIISNLPNKYCNRYYHNVENCLTHPHKSIGCFSCQRNRFWKH